MGNWRNTAAAKVRDVKIFLRAVWKNAALALILWLLGTTLLWVSGSLPEADFWELLLATYHLAVHERVSELKSGVVPSLVVILLPLLILVVAGEGLFRVVRIFMRRKQHWEEWGPMVASDFRHHTVICGLGELGRAICARLLEQDPHARVVLVDTTSDLLVDLGLSQEKYPYVCHVRGDMTSTATLEAANCQQAYLIVLCSGDDGHNLEAGYKANQLNPQAQIFIRLHRWRVQELIYPKENVHIFTPYKDAAERLAQILIQDHLKARSR